MVFVVAVVVVAAVACTSYILVYSILLIGPGLRLIRLTGDPGQSRSRFVLSYCIELVFSPKISSRSYTSGTRGTSPSTPDGSQTTGPVANTDARPPSS